MFPPAPPHGVHEATLPPAAPETGASSALTPALPLRGTPSPGGHAPHLQVATHPSPGVRAPRGLATQTATQTGLSLQKGSSSKITLLPAAPHLPPLHFLKSAHHSLMNFDLICKFPDSSPLLGKKISSLSLTPHHVPRTERTAGHMIGPPKISDE